MQYKLNINFSYSLINKSRGRHFWLILALFSIFCYYGMALLREGGEIKEIKEYFSNLIKLHIHEIFITGVGTKRVWFSSLSWIT
jgi:hypothetical protein